MTLEFVDDQIDIVEIDVGFEAIGTNIFPGIQLASRTVTDDFFVTETDFEILVDASNNSINGQLPQNMANRFLYHIKRIDEETDNIVTIDAYAGDNIDGSSSVILLEQYSDLFIFGASTGYWDNIGGESGGGEIAETLNMLVGDNLGNALDSGIDSALVVQYQDPLPAIPTTLNGVISLLTSYGFCA